MSATGKRYLKPLLLFIFLASVFFLLRYLGGVEKFQQACKNLECLGKWAPFGFIGLYVAAVTLAVPGSALTAMAGVLFGSFYGVIYVSIASTAGAALTFLISRYLARDYVYDRLSKKESFRKLDSMTEKYGAVLVAVVRLIPVFPFSLVNYGFGLTRVHFGVYVFFSWLCMIPGTILYVAGGDAVKRAVAEGRIPWKLLIVIVLVGLFLYFLSRRYRSKFK